MGKINYEKIKSIFPFIHLHIKYSLLKIDFLEVMKRIFGFNQNDNDIVEVEKEADKIRAISNGISWEEFAQSESSKKKSEKI